MGDIDWGTVARSDDPLPDTDTAQAQEVLEVPELTDALLDAIEAENTTTEAPQDEAPTQRGEPGSQVECEICGKSVRVRKDGNLSVHKCEPKAARGNRFENLPTRRSATPRKVREFGINILAWTVEEGSARVIARPFGADPDDVPSELPDAEAMLGPPFDLLWPSIPSGAQKFIEACADNSDLISCALAWADWVRTLGKYTREMRAYSQSLAEQERQHGSTQFAATDGPGRVVPFSPA